MSDLLQRRGKINTELHLLAMSNKHGQLATELSADPEAQKQIDIRTGGQFPRTALQLAVDRGHVETVRVLLKHGASTKVLTNPGRHSLLHIAANKRDKGLVEALLKHDKGLAVQTNSAGDTAAQVALKQGNTVLADYINEVALRQEQTSVIYDDTATNAKENLADLFPPKHLVYSH